MNISKQTKAFFKPNLINLSVTAILVFCWYIFFTAIYGKYFIYGDQLGFGCHLIQDTPGGPIYSKCAVTVNHALEISLLIVIPLSYVIGSIAVYAVQKQKNLGKKK